MIDTHCHLNDDKYIGMVDEVVNNYLTCGIEKVICVGCDNLTNEKAKEIALAYDSVYYAVGIHPDDIDEFDKIKLESYLKNKDKKLVAIGEIGLDYHSKTDNKEKQIEVFVCQIELAKKYGLPIIIHCRDSYGDTLEILKKYAPFEHGAVMHCYSGSLEFAKEIIKLGLKLSFTGTVTFSNAKNVQEVAKNIPIESFFVETDAPYLAPTPFRGQMNEPKNVRLICDFLANLRGISSKEMEKQMDKNAKAFFNI